jgi:probable rRNA maturation factor
MAANISFNKQSRILEHVGLKRKTFRTLATCLFADHKFHVEQISFVFVDDETLLEINNEFLQHDYYTDIITFDLSQTRGEVCADIYISNDRVADNAMKLNTPLQEEMLRVMIHGLLHLCGYRDKTKKEQNTMRTKENEYMEYYKTLSHATG